MDKISLRDDELRHRGQLGKEPLLLCYERSHLITMPPGSLSLKVFIPQGEGPGAGPELILRSSTKLEIINGWSKCLGFHPEPVSLNKMYAWI